ncbi:MAG: hypothetical protein AAF456_00480 [Planctomycetota bacterium]
MSDTLSGRSLASTTSGTAIREFCSGLVDYAGLFPPAGLPLESVIRNYAKYRSGDHAFMLRRLVVPASRLAEFEKLAGEVLPKEPDTEPWRISALLPSVDAADGAFQFAVSGIRQFNERHLVPENGSAVVDAIEIKAPTMESLRETTKQLGNEAFQSFVEIPHREDPVDMINELARLNSSGRFFAKIRTGGVTQELIPAPEEVARFIFCCAENMLGMKATAGLHHPVRSEFNLTYEEDAPRGTMHGFLNVFSAMCAAYGLGARTDELSALLKEDSAGAFEFEQERLVAGPFNLSARKIAAIRDKYAISFGSCSFDEPKDELCQIVFGD